MQIIQLYIGNERVDLFDDESVVLTQSIKDVRDIGKVFTEFTKRFTVPASKNNNKIFKHYYNYDITVATGFDARKKQSATIELNHLAFKKGKIKLDAVELRNNKPHSYKLTFFGNTVQLKDILGEDKLSDIEELETNISSSDFLFNQPRYNSGMISAGLRRNPETGGDFIVPLITHSQRLFYDSASTTANEGNLHVNATYTRGVKFNELKPAIRVHRIVQEIENKYGITFSTDFFNSTNKHYHSLFMWLHRKKGLISSGDALQVYPNQFRNFQPLGSDNTLGQEKSDLIVCRGDRIEVKQALADDLSDASIRVRKASGDNTTAFNLRITRQVGSNEEETIYSSNNITANNTTINYINWNGGFVAGDYRVYIEVLEGVTATFDIVEFRCVSNNDGTFVYDENNVNFQAQAEFLFLVNKQIPEMKVIDFLTGLFKMFNLVAYADDEDTIIVKTLDDYYDASYTSPTPSDVNIYDISEYVDTESVSVSPALPFKEIHFKYADTGSLLAKNHQQVNNEDWGGVEYNAEKENNNELLIDNNIYGGIYKVEAPFHHMKYEKLINNSNKAPTDIQYGFFVDDNEDPYYSKPLLFYPLYINPSEDFNIITSFDANGDYNGVDEMDGTDTVNMPSNTRVKELSDPEVAGERQSLHFTSFPSEYNGSSDFTDTLFETYYKTYIQDKFEPINRMTKVTAFLPPRITSQIKMNDRLIINDRQYRINKIKSNLKTGKSDIELLND